MIVLVQSYHFFDLSHTRLSFVNQERKETEKLRRQKYTRKDRDLLFRGGQGIDSVSEGSEFVYQTKDPTKIIVLRFGFNWLLRRGECRVQTKTRSVPSSSPSVGTVERGVRWRRVETSTPNTEKSKPRRLPLLPLYPDRTVYSDIRPQKWRRRPSIGSKGPDEKYPKSLRDGGCRRNGPLSESPTREFLEGVVG